MPGKVRWDTLRRNPAIRNALIYSPTQLTMRTMRFLSALFCLLSIQYLQAQEPAAFEALPNQTVALSGDLSAGSPMPDLSWAWNSSVACFPATQQTKFNGHHVLYQTIIPAYSEMEIKLIPTDPNHNMSIYAYEIGEQNNSIVPNLPSCIRCEVDHKWDRPWKGKTQDHTRTVKNIVAINRPYKVIIGVTGAEGLSEGAFTIEVSTKSK